MPGQPRPFRIAVVGGGIGGLCAVLSLHTLCPEGSIHVDVYEQAAEYKEIGAGLGIGVNAAKLLHRIGVGGALNGISGHRNGVWISFRRYDTGEEIVTVPVNDQQKIRQSPVHRADFLLLLVDEVKARNAAVLHNNKRCMKLEDHGGDSVDLVFEDGTRATANLVVGCDGIHSSIRSQFRSDNPRYSGRICYRGLVQTKDIDSWWPLPTYSASWLGHNKHFLAFPISRNTMLNVVAFVHSAGEKPKESWTATGPRSEVEKAFADFEPTVRRTISLMNENPSKWVLNDREPLDQWVFQGGKVVLMGDAAHAMLPHQGAGAGQAIEDGYILGRAIKEYLESPDRSLAKWTRLYQDVRLPRAQKAQDTARQAGAVYEMQTPEMAGKSYEECLPIVRDSLKDRMQWVWTGDIDAEYEAMRKNLL